MTRTASAAETLPSSSWLSRIADICARAPGQVLATVLGLHLVVWTALPILLYRNLQLDLAEGLALGREWQLGYWKHPPLPWWIDEIAYWLIGDERAVYVLGPLAAIGCMWVIWRLARELVSPLTALLATLALEGMHFFNFSAVKFAHDTILLPFAALTGWFFYRATARGRNFDWVLMGVFLAGSFWSKYSAALLGATLAIVMIADPVARRAWRTPGPYLAGAVFALVIAPNAWWLVAHGFQPFVYVEEEATTAAHWYQHLTFPLQWAASQIGFIGPALIILLVAGYRGSLKVEPAKTPDETYARRLVTALAIGPVLITMTAALVVGVMPLPRWGYPLWSFVPLAILLWWPPVPQRNRHAATVAIFLLVFASFPLAYGVGELFESLVRDRPKATDFPGREIAARITTVWRERTGQPLSYVGGREFPTNNIADYSPDHPRVVAHGDLSISPWIDPADLKRRGIVLVWDGGGDEVPEDLIAAFPTAKIEPAVVAPRQTLYPTTPSSIGFAIVPPSP